VKVRFVALVIISAKLKMFAERTHRATEDSDGLAPISVNHGTIDRK